MIAGERKARPWGFWATIGFTVIAILGSQAVQSAILIIFLLAAITINGQADIRNLDVEGLLSSYMGFYASVAGIVSSIFSTALVVSFVALRMRMPIKDYLALRMVGKGEYLKWLLFTGILIAAGDLITYLLNRPVVPDSALELYKTAFFTPLLYFAVLVAAPVFEEVLFRGFMFLGLRNSRLGPIGAIVLTALVWSILHVQYEAYYIFYVFITGLLLGLARLKTNSLYVTMAMHAFGNLIASIEAYLVLNVFT